MFVDWSSYTTVYLSAPQSKKCIDWSSHKRYMSASCQDWTKKMNQVGKYKLKSITTASSILQNRLILVLRIFDVLGIAGFLRSLLTVRLCFGGLLTGLFLSLLFAPDFVTWTCPKFGWSQVLGLARSRNITGAWLWNFSECRCTAASRLVACGSSFGCGRRLWGRYCASSSGGSIRGRTSTRWRRFCWGQSLNQFIVLLIVKARIDTGLLAVFVAHPSHARWNGPAAGWSRRKIIWHWDILAGGSSTTLPPCSIINEGFHDRFHNVCILRVPSRFLGIAIPLCGRNRETTVRSPSIVSWWSTAAVSSCIAARLTARVSRDCNSMFGSARLAWWMPMSAVANYLGGTISRCRSIPGCVRHSKPHAGIGPSNVGEFQHI